MAWTYTYDTATPATTDSPTEGDDRIREVKAAIQERLNGDHYFPLTGTEVSDTDAGKHRKVTFYGPLESDPTVDTNELALYTKDVSDVAELFVKDESGNVKQLTTGGALKCVAGDYGADSIDQDDIQLANDSHLVAANAAGDGEVDLIKANSSDAAELPDGATLASSAAPTADAEIANKKYVDDHIHSAGAVQVVNTNTGAVSTTTSLIPDDNTKPQSGEGGEFMTLAITPTSASNKLKIEVVVMIASSIAARVGTVALFQDSTADALAAMGCHFAYSLRPQTVTFTHYMAAGTTSATTFKVRAGLDAAGTLTFNGAGGTRLYGGAAVSSITITEIKV